MEPQFNAYLKLSIDFSCATVQPTVKRLSGPAVCQDLQSARTLQFLADRKSTGSVRTGVSSSRTLRHRHMSAESSGCGSFALVSARLSTGNRLAARSPPARRPRVPQIPIASNPGRPPTSPPLSPSPSAHPTDTAAPLGIAREMRRRHTHTHNTQAHTQHFLFLSFFFFCLFEVSSYLRCCF